MRRQSSGVLGFVIIVVIIVALAGFEGRSAAQPITELGASFARVGTSTHGWALYALTSDSSGRVYIGATTDSASGPSVSRFDAALYSGSAIPLQPFGTALGDPDGIASDGRAIFVPDLNRGLVRIPIGATGAAGAESIFSTANRGDIYGSPVVVRRGDGHVFVGHGYHADDATLWRIDEYSAEGALLRSSPTTTGVQVMTYDARRNRIYYSSFDWGSVSRVFAFNPATGTDSLLGIASGLIDGGLAYDPITDRIFAGTAYNTGQSVAGLVDTFDPDSGVRSRFAHGFGDCLGILREPVSGALYFLESGALWRLDAASVNTQLPPTPGAGTSSFGPIAHWRFDDAQTPVSDYSGNGNNGTLAGNATLSFTQHAPLPGDVASLSLDGASFATIPDSPTLRIPGSFTISAWIRPSALQPSLQNIISKDSVSPGWTNYNFWLFDNKIAPVVSFANGNSGVGTTGVSGGQAFCDSGGCALVSDAPVVDACHPLGTWRQATFVYDHSTKTQRGYLDCGAKAEASFQTTSPLQTDGESVQIGARKSDGRHFNGQIDDVRIWNRALTDAEVAALCPPPPTCPQVPTTLTVSVEAVNQDLQALNTAYVEAYDGLTGVLNTSSSGSTTMTLMTGQTNFAVLAYNGGQAPIGANRIQMASLLPSTGIQPGFTYVVDVRTGTLLSTVSSPNVTRVLMRFDVHQYEYLAVDQNGNPVSGAYLYALDPLTGRELTPAPLAVSAGGHLRLLAYYGALLTPGASYLDTWTLSGFQGFEPGFTYTIDVRTGTLFSVVPSSTNRILMRFEVHPYELRAVDQSGNTISDAFKFALDAGTGRELTPSPLLLSTGGRALRLLSYYGALYTPGSNYIDMWNLLPAEGFKPGFTYTIDVRTGTLQSVVASATNQILMRFDVHPYEFRAVDQCGRPLSGAVGTANDLVVGRFFDFGTLYLSTGGRFLRETAYYNGVTSPNGDWIPMYVLLPPEGFQPGLTYTVDTATGTMFSIEASATNRILMRFVVEPLSCNVACTGAPPAVANGTYGVCASVDNGQICPLTCNAGHTKIGVEPTCAQGSYVGASPTCAPTPCEPNPCQNGGVCTPTGSGYSCACVGDWLGERCDATRCTGVTCTTPPDQCHPIGSCNPSSGQCEYAFVDNAPPVVTCAPARTVECKSQGGVVTANVADCSPYALVSDAPEVFTESTDVTFSATDALGQGPSTCRTAVTVEDTVKPTITCPPTPAPLECTGASMGYSLGEATASDSCVEPTLSDNRPDKVGLGSTVVTFTASDGANTASCDVVVEVVDTQPPVVSCVERIDVKCAPAAGAKVQVPTPMAADACDGPVEDVLSDAPADGVYQPGDTTVTFSATDDSGKTGTCQTIVHVEAAPATELQGKMLKLWPPNHKYTTFDLSACITSVKDACGALTPTDIAANARIFKYGCDEPQSVLGSGATSGDLVVLSANKFKVRAERSGTRDGRVCTVEYVYVNPAGVETVGKCQVGIPHDQGGRATPIDSGYGAGWSLTR